ncbi:MAG TPA: prepilin-type N-terminal cleavage/methylation domain-containing protein [Bacillota bacterium]|jgi:prepilin-type N-terminal cleavage/methylation domain-containing protein|nr:prepilin-type N-terminal cleavage/methylation domain-containing protein [Bacillota bacterium]HPZ60202.1 prepilin-type N-terminal cleavage/methylation domain-containing protein [Bacillota bacterium]HQC82516.1 prepilin-type N-terminal cleavage/methylation domain-containing protein [Bacillota bacterium]
MDQYPRTKGNNKSGFTLIEVALAVVIIAILAAIAVPSVSGVLNNANQSVDNARAGLYENALKIYVSQKAQVREYVYIAETPGSQNLVANSIAYVLDEEVLFETQTRNWVFYYHPNTLQVVAIEYDGVQRGNGMIALIKGEDGTPELGSPDGPLLEAIP